MTLRAFHHYSEGLQRALVLLSAKDGAAVAELRKIWPKGALALVLHEETLLLLGVTLVFRFNIEVKLALYFLV